MASQRITLQLIEMDLKIIKTKKQYQQYLNWIDKMFDEKTGPDGSAGEKLQAVLLLVKQYEDIHYPIPHSK